MRFSFVLAALLLTLSLSKRCQWKDPSTSKTYDLEPLISKKAPHKVEVNVLGEIIKAEYLFNFCDGPKPKCHGQEMHVAEFMEYMGRENKNSCSELGSLTEPTYRLLDQDTEGKGFSMTYSNDRSCMEFNRMTHHLQVKKTSTQFNIYCHHGPTTIEKEHMSARRCTQVFHVYSQAGCPGGVGKNNKQIIREVMKIFAIWLSIVCVLLIGFGLWIDQEKHLYKRMHAISDSIKNQLVKTRMRIQNLFRRNKSEESNELNQYSYTTIGKELQEI